MGTWVRFVLIVRRCRWQARGLGLRRRLLSQPKWLVKIMGRIAMSGDRTVVFCEFLEYSRLRASERITERKTGNATRNR